MTKQNASLKPAMFPVSSDSFRPLVQKFSSNNSSTNSMTSSSNGDVTKSKKSNVNLTVNVSSPMKKEKMYALDDMSPSRSGTVRDRVTAAGDLFGDINSAFAIMRTPLKNTPPTTTEVANFEYSTIYKNAEARDFEVVRNLPLFPSRGTSRCPSKSNSRAPSPAPVHEDPPVEAVSTNLTTESTSEFADPIEVFTAFGSDWHSYRTEDGDLYYLILATGHSQWEDPRVSGLVEFEYEQEQPVGDQEEGALDTSIGSIPRSSIKSPPTSPSPKSPSPSLINEQISVIKHEVHNPFNDMHHLIGERRTSFSPAELERKESKESAGFSDEKELLSFAFDEKSVARNFRWVDDSDASFGNGEYHEHEPEDTTIEPHMGSIGIADVHSPIIEVDTRELEKNNGEECGPESHRLILFFSSSSCAATFNQFSLFFFLPARQVRLSLKSFQISVRPRRLTASSLLCHRHNLASMRRN